MTTIEPESELISSNLEGLGQNQGNYIRVLEFLIIAATLIAGIQLELYEQNPWVIVLFVIFYPITALSSLFLIRKSKPDLDMDDIRANLVVVDSLVIGMSLAALEFRVIPTLMILIIANANAMAVGGVRNWGLSIGAMALGAVSAKYAFGFELQILAETPMIFNIVSIVGVGIFVGVTAFYSQEQSRYLMRAQKNIQNQQQQSIELSKKLAKYLPPQVWGSFFSGRREAKLHTDRKPITVFFSDIKGFSELSESLPLDALTKLLNSYLNEMTKIALRHGGTIDKFIGDAVMVFFGDPATQGEKEDAVACVSMAIEMQQYMKVMQYKWAREGFRKPLEIRIGINSGMCTVGNFGADTRMDYTILGTEVNLASRLESASRPGKILISQKTYSLTNNFIKYNDVGKIKVKGFADPQPVYEVVDLKSNLGKERLLIQERGPGFMLHVDINKINHHDTKATVKILLAAKKSIREKKEPVNYEINGCYVSVSPKNIPEERRDRLINSITSVTESLKKKMVT